MYATFFPLQLLTESMISEIMYAFKLKAVFTNNTILLFGFHVVD